MQANIIKKSLFRVAVFVVMALALMFIFNAVTAHAGEDSLFPEKNGDGVYEIYTPDQFTAYLRATASRSTTYEGQTFPADAGSACILKKDIDYSDASALKFKLDNQYGNTFARLFAYSNTAFRGTIDGNGHTLRALPDCIYKDSSNWTSDGGAFIGYNAGTIKNLKFDAGDITVRSQNYTYGILVGSNMENGIISGVTLRGDIKRSGGYISMFCGDNSGVIKDCSTHGSLTNDKPGGSAAALVMRVRNGGRLINCYNTAAIKTNATDGKPMIIESYLQPEEKGAIIKNCYNIGKMYKGDTQKEEIFGVCHPDDYSNCYKSTDRFSAADLGAGFRNDLEGSEAINNGYPVLKYEITGEYPHVESAADLEVKSIRKPTNTSLIFTCDTEFDYYNVKPDDIIVRVTNEGGVTADLKVNSLSWGKNTKSITYPSIQEAKSADGTRIQGVTDQKVTIQLVTGGKVQDKSVKFDIPASAKWSDYAEKPKKIGKTDEVYSEKYEGWYKIEKPEELAWVAKQMNEAPVGQDADFEDNLLLANDIYLNDTSDPNWKDSKNLRFWDIPIGYLTQGTGTRIFRGEFEGNGYKVAGMYCDAEVSKTTAPHARSLGLFGAVSNTVGNLTVEDTYIKGNSSVDLGGITGSAYAGAIRNCSFSGEIAGGKSAGGIVGTDTSSELKIENCANFGTLRGAKDAAGGIIGSEQIDNFNAVKDCYNAGSVSDSKGHGSGILCTGRGKRNITNCYNAGDAEYGIIHDKSVLNNCYTHEDRGIILFGAESVSEAQAKDGTLLSCLNSGAYTSDIDGINKGYPVLTWQTKLAGMKLKYPQELRSYVDLKEYAKNGDKVQQAIDDALQKIENAKTAEEAEAAYSEAKKNIDAIPSDEQIKRNLDEELEDLQRQLKKIQGEYNFMRCLISLDRSSYVYSGNANTPAVKVVNASGETLVQDADYTAEYSDNVNPGLAKVAVTGKGDYSGTVNLTFKITPEKMKLGALKKGKRQITVSWIRNTKVTGYQINYGLAKNFRKAKTVKITGASVSRKTIKKLAAKKTYYVRIRAYKNAGGKPIYGTWSASKRIRTN